MSVQIEMLRYSKYSSSLVVLWSGGRAVRIELSIEFEMMMYPRNSCPVKHHLHVSSLVCVCARVRLCVCACRVHHLYVDVSLLANILF